MHGFIPRHSCIWYHWYISHFFIRVRHGIMPFHCTFSNDASTSSGKGYGNELNVRYLDITEKICFWNSERLSLRLWYCFGLNWSGLSRIPEYQGADWWERQGEAATWKAAVELEIFDRVNSTPSKQVIDMTVDMNIRRLLWYIDGSMASPPLVPILRRQSISSSSMQAPCSGISSSYALAHHLRAAETCAISWKLI